ncbi:hypothetical protein ABZX92_34235 [Lentzea sp. NPDC006480]|uniref:hypothetical protein n=1 Tax=Lentzea sp. NPDC006480 TaxID=3157176 RepID=UPI0033B042E9
MSRPESVYCPGVAGPGVWEGKTHPDGVIVRSGPGKDFPSKGERLPGGCTLPLAGFCHGQTLRDAWLDLPDNRWFRLNDGRFVASTVVFGNPGPDVEAQPCAGGIGPPELTALEGNLTVKGERLPMVGIARLREDLRWEQVALVPADHDRATTSLAEPPGTRIAVVACAAAAWPQQGIAAIVTEHGLVDQTDRVADPQARHAACRAPDRPAAHQ